MCQDEKNTKGSHKKLIAQKKFILEGSVFRRKAFYLRHINRWKDFVEIIWSFV